MFHPRFPVAAAAGFFTAALIYGSGSLAQSATRNQPARRPLTRMVPPACKWWRTAIS